MSWIGLIYIICRPIARKKSDYRREAAEFFRKKVTKRGTPPNKKRHFVDKVVFLVDEQADLCGCMHYRCGDEKRQEIVRRVGFVAS